MRAASLFLVISMATVTCGGTLAAQVVLFDFDGAPVLSSLPIDQSAGGITAHLSATGQGYSIQEANVLGFTPPGFAGRILYPNSGTLSDLLVKFDQALTDFSIMYTPNELGCDNSATMRVTAYMNGNVIGTATKTASYPGTWPVDTLRGSFAQGFDSVVVHYDSPPPTCKDYGTIFMADNMRVTSSSAAVPAEKDLPGSFSLSQNFPNPFNPSTTIRYALPHRTHVTLAVFDLLGQQVAQLVKGEEMAGNHEVRFDGDGLASGVYFYRLQAGGFVAARRFHLVR